jgi:hypothetical protein
MIETDAMATGAGIAVRRERLARVLAESADQMADFATSMLQGAGPTAGARRPDWRGGAGGGTDGRAGAAQSDAARAAGATRPP